MKTNKYKVLALAAAVSISFWLLDALSDYVLYSRPFWKLLFYDKKEIYFRLFFSVLFFILTLFVAGILAKKRKTEERLRNEIKEREATEEALEKSEKVYRALFENARDAIFLMKTEGEDAGRIVAANKSAADMHGYTLDELLTLKIMDVDTPESARNSKALIGQIFQKGSVRGELFHQKKDGTIIPIEFSAGLVELGDEKFILAVDRDITERKQTENQLRLYSEAIEAANDCIQILDLNGCIIYSSKAVKKIYGYTPGELTGVHVNFLNADKRIADKVIIPSMQKDGIWDGELMVKHKDGRTLPIWLTASFIRNGQNEPIAMVGVIKDITERKHTEDLIKASLREKETLIKEIYHRTKNNMQVISSLLNLQVSSIGDERLSGIFRETQNRIKAMSLVHEKLYQSGDLSRIIIKNYIEDLVNALLQSYRPESEKINVCYDLEELSLPLETVTPVGLIINELMSNSLKYAFPDKNGNCEVRISLHSAGGDGLKLVFSDNGIGLPEGFDLEKVKTLGLNLIQNLAEKQLNGRVEHHVSKGTEFRIIFKEVRIKSRTEKNGVLAS